MDIQIILSRGIAIALMGKFSLRIHLKSLEIDRVSIYNVNNGIKSRKEYIVSTINNIKFVNAWVDACNKSAGVKSVASKLDITLATNKSIRNCWTISAS